MTDHEHDLRAHLSDETLSSHVDTRPDAGVADQAAVEAHLAICASCRARLASLSAARSLVATPVAPAPEDARSRAIAAAMTEWDASSRGPGTHEDELEARRRARPAWYRDFRVVAGAAAAIVAIAVGVPLVLSSSGTTSSASSASQRQAARSQAHSGGKATGTFGASSAAPATPSAGSQLGSPQASPSGAAGGFVTGLPDLGRIESRSELVAALQQNAPSPASSSQAVSSTGASSASAFDATEATCIESARNATHGGPDGPGTVATATYQGHKALVMEFWPTTSPPPVGSTVVAVVSTDGCTLLARTTL